MQRRQRSRSRSRSHPALREWNGAVAAEVEALESKTLATGSGVWQVAVQPVTGAVVPGRVFVADFDGNGRPDILGTVKQ